VSKSKLTSFNVALATGAVVIGMGVIGDLRATDAPEPAARTVAADYDSGTYSVNATIGGRPVAFVVDTGDTITSINNSTLFDGQPVGEENVTLADGSQRREGVYLVRDVCVSGICAAALKVAYEPKGANLLGTDFLEAAHVSLAIKHTSASESGAMTLSAE
jgi:predicted aspartyl protease